jgi:hypothetical protein
MSPVEGVEVDAYVAKCCRGPDLTTPTVARYIGATT